MSKNDCRYRPQPSGIKRSRWEESKRDERKVRAFAKSEGAISAKSDFRR
jgi:hypothetical protein